MRRFSWHRYALAAPGTGSMASDGRTAPAPEMGRRSCSHLADDQEMDDSSNVWSPWIDLGGEG